MTPQKTKTSDSEYTLMLYFDAQNPVIRANISERLAQLSPKTADKIDQFLTRGRIVLKRKANPVVDQRIVDLWIGTGAKCRFEKVSGPIDNTTAAPEKKTDTKNPSHNSRLTEMMCPLCRRQQIVAQECRYCGVIINKAKVRPQPLPIQKKADDDKLIMPTQLPPPTGWPALVIRCGQIFRRVKRWVGNEPEERAKIVRWSQRLIDAFTHLAIILVIALLLEISLLHLGHGMWFIYTSTPLGQHYLAMADTLGPSFQYVAQMNLAMLGLEVTLTALLACLTIGAVGQFFHLIRLFHEPLSFFAKVILWTLPLTGATGWMIHCLDPMIPFGITCIISFVPALLLFNRSLYLARTMVPEFGTLISAVGRTTGGFNRLVGMLKKRS